MLTLWSHLERAALILAGILGVPAFFLDRWQMWGAFVLCLYTAVMFSVLKERRARKEGYCRRW